jgi:hypothetical protein
MYREPDERPRQLGEDEEPPDDFGSQIGDTLPSAAPGPTSVPSAPTRPAAGWRRASSPTWTTARLIGRWRSPRAT